MNPYKPDNELAIAWVDLSYVKKSLITRKPKQILSSLNGRINFYSLTALMGPSGAGKTTLLKCINMRNTGGLTSDTKLFVNKYIKLKTCFIMQDQSEHLMVGLTVRESLLFASKIKNKFSTKIKFRENYAQTGPSLLSVVEDSSEASTYSYNDNEPIDKNGNFDHNKNLSKILSELLLEDCSNNLVNNCSGGEQKRLSIGLELVAMVKPNLLCIDEPTSGLDSNAAELVIQCLSELSNKHQMAIVTSIHQPNSLLMSMFDQLYVMAKGGHCVFSDKPNQLRLYLIECGIRCPDDVLPIEVLLKVSSRHPTKVIDELAINSLPKIKIQSRSEESVRSLVLGSEEIDRLIDKAFKRSTKILDECKHYAKRVYQIGNNESLIFNCYDFYYLLLRGFTCLIRYQWRSSAALALFAIVIAFQLKYMYGSDVGHDSGCLDIQLSNQTNTMTTSLVEALDILSQESKVILNMKCQFFAVAFLQFVSMACSILMFPSEVKIILNEHNNKWYSTSSYYWSKYFIEIPISIAISYLYSTIIYYGTGQLSDYWRFGYFAIISTSGMIIASSCGNLIGIIFPHNFQVATTSGVALYLVLILLSGFFVPLNTLNSVIQGSSYLSFIKITFESILLIIYGFERCNDSQMQLLLHQLDIKDELLESHMFWMIGHIIMWRIIGLLTLIFIANDFSFVSKYRPKFLSKDEKLVNNNIAMDGNQLKCETTDTGSQ